MKYFLITIFTIIFLLGLTISSPLIIQEVTQNSSLSDFLVHNDIENFLSGPKPPEPSKRQDSTIISHGPIVEYNDGLRWRSGLEPNAPWFVVQPTPHSFHIVDFRNSYALLYKLLLDESEGGIGLAKTIFNMIGDKEKVIRIYNLSYEDKKEIETCKRIFRRIFQQYSIKILLGNECGLWSNPNDDEAIERNVKAMAEAFKGEEYLAGYILGNEDNYYVEGRYQGWPDRINKTFERYFIFYNKLAGNIKNTYRKAGLSFPAVFIGLGDFYYDSEEKRLLEDLPLDNIDGLSINTYAHRSEQTFIDLFKMVDGISQSRKNNGLRPLGVLLGAVGNPLEDQKDLSQVWYMRRVWSTVARHAAGKNRCGNFLGMFWFELTPEQWRYEAALALGRSPEKARKESLFQVGQKLQIWLTQRFGNRKPVSDFIQDRFSKLNIQELNEQLIMGHLPENAPPLQGVTSVQEPELKLQKPFAPLLKKCIYEALGMHFVDLSGRGIYGDIGNFFVVDRKVCRERYCNRLAVITGQRSSKEDQLLVFNTRIFGPSGREESFDEGGRLLRIEEESFDELGKLREMKVQILPYIFWITIYEYKVRCRVYGAFRSMGYHTDTRSCLVHATTFVHMNGEEEKIREAWLEKVMRASEAMTPRQMKILGIGPNRPVHSYLERDYKSGEWSRRYYYPIIFPYNPIAIDAIAEQLTLRTIVLRGPYGVKRYSETSRVRDGKMESMPFKCSRLRLIDKPLSALLYGTKEGEDTERLKDQLAELIEEVNIERSNLEADVFASVRNISIERIINHFLKGEQLSAQQAPVPYLVYEEWDLRDGTKLYSIIDPLYPHGKPVFEKKYNAKAASWEITHYEYDRYGLLRTKRYLPYIVR